MIERTPLAVQQAERDYDLTRAAELKYGRLREVELAVKAAEDAIKARA